MTSDVATKLLGFNGVPEHHQGRCSLAQRASLLRTALARVARQKSESQGAEGIPAALLEAGV